MEEIRTIKLEILRQGPAHNQLLSPLTQYIALCGADGPAPVRIPFEQQQLLNRLERLRYLTPNGPIPASQREAEVHDLGVILGGVLSQVPGLLATFCNSGSTKRQMNHLRLALSANEMSLIPFEFAIGANGFPGSGSPLFLQSQAPITLTREVRRGQPIPVQWDRPVRILFAFASPPDLAPVPAQAHLEALRRAIAPLVRWQNTSEERINEVKQILTVLPDASLEDIRDACGSTEFSHVHILAHGAPREEGGDHHYGLILRASDDAKGYQVVDGERLAMALTTTDHHLVNYSAPTFVSLSTCDSATVNTVLTPGGSIAHALHAGGIPWVIASQFPLWMQASTLATETLYKGLLEGEDPRWLLHMLRQRLYTDSANTHDWGSIVAYAIVPTDFDQQLERFRNRQILASINLKFDKVEQLDTTKSNGVVEALYEEIRGKLQGWLNELPEKAPSEDQALRLGMSGASEKRIGIHYDNNRKREQARRAYKKASEFYRRAFEVKADNHWALTQYLSLAAILGDHDQSNRAADPALTEWWTAARRITELQLKLAASGKDRAWALGTMAELELLGAVYAESTFNRKKVTARIVSLCGELLRQTGADSFPADSTRRQFQRYLDFWRRKEWRELARKAVNTLSPTGS